MPDPTPEPFTAGPASSYIPVVAELTADRDRLAAELRQTREQRDAAQRLHAMWKRSAEDRLGDLTKTRDEIQRQDALLTQANDHNTEIQDDNARLERRCDRLTAERDRFKTELAAVRDAAWRQKQALEAERTQWLAEIASLIALIAPYDDEAVISIGLIRKALREGPAPVPGSSHRAPEPVAPLPVGVEYAYAEGYREAVARLRDDARYRNWWTARPGAPGSYPVYWDGPGRTHLADYLETVGPDGVDVETGRWPAREQAVIRAAIAWRNDPTWVTGRALIEAVDALPHIGERCDRVRVDMLGEAQCVRTKHDDPAHRFAAGEAQASEPAERLAATEPTADQLRWHVGRHWMGNEIEKTCPCPKEPCGLVDPTRAVPECEHHPLMRGKSIRQSHRAHQCHAAQAAAPKLATGGIIRASDQGGPILASDSYTAETMLCDDDGIVRKGWMHHGTDYPCTGHAHFSGDHIRCTNPVHVRRAPASSSHPGGGQTIIAAERPVDLDDRARPTRSTKFQSAAAGRPLDLVDFRSGSGRHYGGERSDTCPGDGIPGHRHDITCIRPPSPPKPPTGRPQTFA